jgi:hypothetical protein
METMVTSRVHYDMPPEWAHPDTDSAWTIAVWGPHGTTRSNPQPGILNATAILQTEGPGQCIAWASPPITLESAASEQIEISKAIAHSMLKAMRQHSALVSPDITSEFAGGKHREAMQQRSAWTSSNITPESATSEQIFDAIQSFYLSKNSMRDRQIAARMLALYRDALAEDERILSASLRQFTDFFLAHPDLSLPRITLTPDGTLRVRWIQGEGSFTAIEFTGKLLAKLVAEIPREQGLTAQHFSREPVTHILSVARAIGASFVGRA